MCSFEPVKYWRAAPNDSAGTMRRSTWSDVGQPDRHLRFAATEHLFDRRIGREPIHDLGWVVGFDEDIEIADRFLAAPIAPGDFKLLDTGAGEEMVT